MQEPKNQMLVPWNPLMQLSVNLSTSSGRLASSTRKCHRLLVNINLKTTSKSFLLFYTCSKTSVPDLKWITSGFPSPVQTICFQLSIFYILCIIGFMDVVFSWYCQFSKKHLPLRSWPYYCLAWDLWLPPLLEWFRLRWGLLFTRSSGISSSCVWNLITKRNS